MNIVIAFNHRYAEYAMVLLTSLFLNNGEDEITVYILHRDLTPDDEKMFAELAEGFSQMIRFIRVDLSRYQDILPTTESWSMEMYYRLLVGELLPQNETRALYLDTDIVVNGGIREFYHMELDNCEIAAADDPMIQGNFSKEQQELFAAIPQEIRYFNSGVLLFDLGKIRENHSFEEYMRIAGRAGYRLTNPDQDLLNAAHAGNVKYIDRHIWNAFSQCEAMEGRSTEDVEKHAAIIHYAGRKPWNSNGMHYGIEKIWWNYAKKTPFYQTMMEKVFFDDLEDGSYQRKMALLQENAQLKKDLEQSVTLCRKLCGMLNIEV